MITRTPEDVSPKVAPRVELHGPAAEYYQALLAQLRSPAAGSDVPQTLGITSCSRGEGVSTVAANLAIAAAAQSNQRVLLVEANFRKPVLAKWLDADHAPGLAQLMGSRCHVNTAIHRTSVPELLLLPWGERDAATANFDLVFATELLSDLKASFDVIVFDLPPAHSTSVALPLAGLLDGVVLVLETERVSWEVARRTRDMLTLARATVLGVVLNKQKNHLPAWV